MPPIDNSQRRRRIHVSQELLASLLGSHGFPEGSSIVGAQCLMASGTLEMSLENPAFEPVVAGSEYPLLDIDWKQNPPVWQNDITKPLKRSQIQKAEEPS